MNSHCKRKDVSQKMRVDISKLLHAKVKLFYSVHLPTNVQETVLSVSGYCEENIIVTEAILLNLKLVFSQATLKFSEKNHFTSAKTVQVMRKH